MAKRRSRKNPYPSYHRTSFSADNALNRAATFYYPGTLWDYYEAGEFAPSEATPVNRRNPRKKARRNSAKAMKLKHERGISLKEAWRIVKGGAASNPGVAPYWPRNSVYELSDGPFGATKPLPVNRRNPRKKARRNAGTMVGRFPSPCTICGQSMKGHPIVRVGTGPRGGKQMAHANCAGR